MAKAEANPAVEESEEQQGEPVKGKSKLIIIGSFVGFILLELIVLVLFLPTPSQTGQSVAEIQKENLEKIEESPLGGITLDPGAELMPSPGDLIEIPLENPFTVQLPSEDGLTTTTLRAKFVLLYHKDDKRRFEKEYTNIPLQLHSEIYQILKTSKEQDVRDPLTKRIRLRIRNAANALFSKPPIIVDVKVLDWYLTTD